MSVYFLCFLFVLEDFSSSFFVLFVAFFISFGLTEHYFAIVEDGRR